jgi:carbonic anhydrase
MNARMIGCLMAIAIDGSQISSEPNFKPNFVVEFSGLTTKFL